jgi:hypothetical protein
VHSLLKLTVWWLFFQKNNTSLLLQNYFSSAVQAYAVLWGPDVQNTQVGLLADDNSPMIRDI